MLVSQGNLLQEIGIKGKSRCHYHERMFVIKQFYRYQVSLSQENVVIMRKQDKNDKSRCTYHKKTVITRTFSSRENNVFTTRKQF